MTTEDTEDTEKRPAWRDVFFTRASAPLIERFPASRWNLSIYGAASLAASVGLWYWFKALQPGMPEFLFWWLAFLSWVAAEPLSLLLGAQIGAQHAQRWKRDHRLTELAVTNLRPLEIGQLALGQNLKPVVWALGLSFLGFAFALAAHHPARLQFLIPFGLCAFNALVTLYVGAWAGLCFQIRLGSIGAVRAMAGFVLVYFLGFLPFVFVMALGAFVPASMRGRDPTGWILCPLLIVVACGMTAIKGLYARAYAGRWRDAVFPQIDL